MTKIIPRPIDLIDFSRIPLEQAQLVSEKLSAWMHAGGNKDNDSVKRLIQYLNDLSLIEETISFSNWSLHNYRIFGIPLFAMADITIEDLIITYILFFYKLFFTGSRYSLFLFLPINHAPICPLKS